MFGIIYWLIGLGAVAKDSIENNIYKEQQKNMASDKEFKLFYDRKGRKFWDGEQVFYGYSKDGKHHNVLEKNDGSVVWDFTQKEIDKKDNILEEKNNLAKENAIKEGRLYYFKRIGNRMYKVEISTERMFDVVCYAYAKPKYYKKYYHLNKDNCKEYEDKIEITQNEYYNLGCSHSN